MKLKVCGMREPNNIAALSDLLPDYMGFIFWAPSSRYVNETTPKLDKSIKKTGVFVDASVDYI
ncbi:MAG: phosphoribosylanthranilate isomerase, partial [Flavobacteriaceae bacterium]